MVIVLYSALKLDDTSFQDRSMKEQCAYCTLSGMMHSYTQLLYLNNGGIVCYLFIGITLMCLFCCVRFELDDEINLFLYEPRPLPTCLIIGARKCGTRALLQFLSLHPKLRIVTQELHFFDNDTAYELGLSWYRSQMPLANHSGGVTIEKTPGYFTSLLAPSRVYRLNPKMRLVLIVRNPVVRAISDFTQVVHTKRSKGKLVQTFEQAVFDRDGSVRVAYKPVRNSLYALHLRHWLAYFPIDQIHIADGDRLIEEPIVELRAVERFLNLPPHIGAEQLYFNRTKGFYCYVHPVDGPSCLGNTKGRAHVRVSVEARQKLQEFFQPHNKQFYALINRTFNWVGCVDVAHFKRDFSRSRPLCDLLQPPHKASR
ncbi:Heparan sulfate glucosamine 3-O-sulfotransferase 5 [Trichinella sp. T9]|nr:Heparan sulfate glucosamine 3-O-sulfotransferase 5 [Trichinella sp. T9]